MDPVTLAGAAVGFALIAGSMKSDTNQWERDRSLSEAVEETRDNGAQLPVLAVHIRQVEMAPEFQGERLKLCVKYGVRGGRLRCDTAGFTPGLHARPRVSRLVHRQPAAHACAELSSTCLFLFSSDIEPVIRLTVFKAGIRRRSVAKASIPLATLSEMGEAELPLRGPSGENLGQVRIACCVSEVRRGNLVGSLALASADRQSDAYLISGAAPIVEGKLVNESSDSGDSTGPASPITPLAGQRVSLHAAGGVMA